MNLAALLSLLQVAGIGGDEVLTIGLKVREYLIDKGYDADTATLDEIIADSNVREDIARKEAAGG